MNDLAEKTSFFIQKARSKWCLKAYRSLLYFSVDFTSKVLVKEESSVPIASWPGVFKNCLTEFDRYSKYLYTFLGTELILVLCVAEEKQDRVMVDCITEGRGFFHSTKPDLLLVLFKLTGKYPTVRVDLDAFASVEIGILPQVFDFHPSTIRDCFPESDLPKVDDFEGKD